MEENYPKIGEFIFVGNLCTNQKIWQNLIHKGHIIFERQAIGSR
jgi:hypothetical protein